MSRKIKKSFERLQKVAILTLCVVFSWSCQNRKDLPEEPLSDELISFNLSESGTIDPELLIGEWDAIKFAYTADGQKISDVVKIKSADLVIPVAPTDTVCEVYDTETGMHIFSEQWNLRCINGSMWLASISGNSIRFTLCGTTKRGLPHYPHEEQDIYWAFYNAKSFVIKGNEAMIYFAGDEDDKDFISIAGEKKINLIILKKR